MTPLALIFATLLSVFVISFTTAFALDSAPENLGDKGVMVFISALGCALASMLGLLLIPIWAIAGAF